MSFTGHELSGAKPPTGSQTDGKYGFKVSWRLTSSSSDDGPNAALSYVEANIARREECYTLSAVNISSSESGGISGDSNTRAILKNVEVEKLVGSANPWLWFATLTYEEPEGGGEGEKPEGGTTGDPIEFAAEIDIQTVQYRKPCDKAAYKSGFSGIAHAKVNDATRRPIVNSALAVFDPPPEVDDHRWVIRIKKNIAALDCDTVKCNAINTKEIVVSYRGISKTIPALCGKTRDISAHPVKHPVIGWYVEVQLFIDVDEDNDWRLEVQDRGFSARAMLGDPDGHGGTIYSDSRAFVEDIAPQRRLCDAEGLPCSEPQLLNGDGQPLLDFTKTTGAMAPVYSVWANYVETDFGSWPILADMIEDTSASP